MIQTRLERTNTKKYVVEFTVRGRTTFPIDMLRYDSCFPQTASDSQSIRCVQEYNADTEVRLVHYHQDGEWEPAYERWQSFGWSVLGGPR